MPGQLLTQKAAAAFLGIPVRRLRRYTKNGQIPVFIERPGAWPVYSTVALEAWQRSFADNMKAKAS